MEVLKNILFTNYELEDNLNIYGVLSNSKVFKITISKVIYKNILNNIDINNIFVPVSIINKNVKGYHVKFKIDDDSFLLNKFIQNINEFNYLKCFSLINCEIPHNLWIVINSMIFEYCNFHNMRINKLEIYDNKDLKLYGNNKKYNYLISKKNIKYNLENDINFNKSEDKIFIPIYLTKNFLEGFIIETEFNNIKQNINKKKINIIENFSKLEYCLIKGCIFTKL